MLRLSNWISTDTHWKVTLLDPRDLPFLCRIPEKRALSPILVQTGNEQTVMDFVKRQLKIPSTIIATYSRDNIQYIKVVLYVLYKLAV